MISDRMIKFGGIEKSECKVVNLDAAKLNHSVISNNMMLKMDNDV